MTIKFEIGRSYTTRSIVDADYTHRYTVTDRTAKFITVEDRSGATKRVGVKVSDGSEWAMPDGRYSMAPVIRAERVEPGPYVTVFAGTRDRWYVASREGDVITHTRLNATRYVADEARAEAEAMFPDHLVILPDDPKPWKEAA